MLLLDAGGVSRLSRRTQDSAALIVVLRRDALWPPVVPSIVLVESLTGRPRNDAVINRFIKTCDVLEHLPDRLARRAGELRAHARRGSAVDAVVVATAEPGGTVLTGDTADLGALASYAHEVVIRRI